MGFFVCVFFVVVVIVKPKEKGKVARRKDCQERVPWEATLSDS